MADQGTPLDTIIGEGADAGPGAKPEAQQQPAPMAVEGGVIPPPPEREEQPGTWAYAALQDERSKRQAFQQQVRQLQEERDALLRAQQQPQQPPEKWEDQFWQSPEGAIDQKLKNMEANFSFRMAHREHGDDFERAWNGMLQLAHAGDPSVVRWCMSTPDPGMAMMQWYAAALRQQQGGRGQAGPVMPSNLSGARNVGSRRGPGWSGPMPLDDIFDRGRGR